ncbi:T9SS type A sorting domain-containing protein [Flavobacterium sp. MFBS3-15]|uniref:T9SS type A sorting domain-containing protein n=1 Tax=Flavobacterium sp. MFBS3-15 TaxID=2989816 RepID=UPI002235EB29|nr:T9SS type A sorting domain-containing protein [Flavobacterium sp. MFBS3-15]MCW4468612.1 T9SS type A sorting domain-containing protein [Flavobacterium sp. MFBS3-15]
MKKIYSLLSVVALTAISANAQNLVSNGGFEAWTDGAPEGFTVTVPANGGSLTQETGAANINEGTSSAKFTAPAGTGNVKAAVTDIPVTPGHSYIFSYWVKDESDNAKGRHWASWRSGANQLTDNLDVLQPDYMANTSGWQQVTYTLTAPATATAFRLDFRIYQEAAGADSGIIYYDGVSLIDQSTAGVKDNAISGLKVFPNPLSGNTLNITSDSSEAKTVAIYDVLGKQVVNTTTANEVINVNLTSGVYIVKIQQGNAVATRKLVVK